MHVREKGEEALIATSTWMEVKNSDPGARLPAQTYFGHSLAVHPWVGFLISLSLVSLSVQCSLLQYLPHRVALRTE